MPPDSRISFSMFIFLSLCMLCAQLLPWATYAGFTAGNENSPSFEVENVLFVGLRHQIIIQNPAYDKVARGDLIVPMLMNKTACHYVVSCNFSSPTGQPTTLITDDSGNMYAIWNNRAVAPMQNLTVQIDYQVLSLEIRRIVNSSLAEDYDRTSETYTKFTLPENLIESDSPQVTEMARNLTVNLHSPHKKAARIYEFVSSHVRYVPQKYEKGALWALQNKVGDCSEYAYLFVALCRATGIPARIQTGFSFHFINEELESGHMWAEYYLEGHGWLPVDATWRLFDASDGRHFCSMQSTPKIISYSNFVFNDTEDSQAHVTTTQKISLLPLPLSLNSNVFVQKAVEAAERINDAKLATFFEKLFGMSLVFPLQDDEIDLLLLRSKLHLQQAFETWSLDPDIAVQHVADAANTGEEALQRAWMMIAFAFAIFISIMSVISLIFLRFARPISSRVKMLGSN